MQKYEKPKPLKKNIFLCRVHITDVTRKKKIRENVEKLAPSVRSSGKIKDFPMLAGSLVILRKTHTHRFDFVFECS